MYWEISFCTHTFFFHPHKYEIIALSVKITFELCYEIQKLSKSIFYFYIRQSEIISKICNLEVILV